MGRDPSSIHPGKEGTPLPSSEVELCSTERRRRELYLVVWGRKGGVRGRGAPQEQRLGRTGWQSGWRAGARSDGPGP